MKRIKFVGLDVHVETISVAVAEQGGARKGESSKVLCGRSADRTRAYSPRQLPTDHDYAASTREYQSDQQGNALLRFLWGEAGAHAVRRDPALQRFYRRKLVQKGLGKARVAVARKLGIRLWIMLRDQIEYNEFCRRGQKQQNSGAACAGRPGTRNGATSHRPVD